MRSSATLLVLAGVIALALIIVLVKFGHASHTSEIAIQPLTLNTSAPPNTEISQSSASNPHAVEGSDAMPVGVSKPVTNWSDRVDTILASDVSESDKVQQFLEMFPALPVEGQEAVANHLSNLLPNEQYGQMAQFVTNAALPPGVLDILLRDALNRPNSLKLPVLLDVARNPQHPNAAQAKDALVTMLGEDDGDDWAKWEAKVNDWLKENPN